MWWIKTSIEEHVWDLLEHMYLWDVNDDCKVDGTRYLDVQRYRDAFPNESEKWFPKPKESGIQMVAKKTEGDMEGDVMVNRNTLVECLMDAARWKELLPSIIVNASMIDHGPLAPTRTVEITAEIQSLSPLVGITEVNFERKLYSKSQFGSLHFLVVDTPKEGSNLLPHLRCCVVRPSPTSDDEGLSKVTCIEMMQFRTAQFHTFFPFLLVGSEQWFWTIYRECRRSRRQQLFPPQGEFGPLVSLAKEMESRFYLGISSATRSTVNRHQSFFSATSGQYWSICATQLINLPARELFDMVKAFDSGLGVGEIVMEIPPDDIQLSLHNHSDGNNNCIRQSFLDGSGGLVLTAIVDVASAVVYSVLAFSIHLHTSDAAKSFLTVTIVDPSAAHLNKYPHDWTNTAKHNIKSFFAKLPILV